MIPNLDQLVVKTYMGLQHIHHLNPLLKPKMGVTHTRLLITTKYQHNKRIIMIFRMLRTGLLQKFNFSVNIFSGSGFVALTEDLSGENIRNLQKQLQYLKLICEQDCATEREYEYIFALLKWRILSQPTKIGSGKNEKYFFPYWA